MIKKILIILAIFFAGTLAFVAYLGLTTSGLRLSFRIAQHYAPGKLSAEKLAGSLFKQVQVEGLDFRNKTIVFKTKTANLHWNLLSLLTGTLSINQLKANHVTVHTFSTQETSALKTPPKDTSAPLKLPININLKHLEITHIRYQQDHAQATVIQSFKLSAKSEHNSIIFNNFHVKSDPYQLDFRGTLALNSKANTKIIGKSLNYADKEMNSEFLLRGNLTQSLNITVNSNKTGLFNLKGSIEKPLSTGTMHLSGKWREITWIFPGKFALTAENGKLNLEGTFKHYTFTSHTKVFTDRTPPLMLSAEATGNSNGLQVKKVQIKTGAGQATLSGDVTWSPYLRWQLKINSQNFNSNVWLPRTRSDANMLLTANGQLKQKQLTAQVNLQSLSGTYNRHSLSGKGRITVNKKNIQLKQLNLSLGNNTLTANGQLSQHSNFHWDINIKQLKLLYPNIHGALYSTGKITQDIAKPNIQTNTTLKKLKTGFLKTRYIKLVAHLDTSLAGKLQLSLNSDQSNWRWLHIKGLKLHLDGDKQKHQFKFNATVNHEKFSLRSNGALQAGLLTETLTQFNLTQKNRLDWHLNKPVIFKQDKQALSLSDFCWLNGKESLCAKGNFHKTKNWKSQLKLQHFNLQFINAFLPPIVAFNSNIDANVQLHGDGTETYKAKLNMLAKHFGARYALEDKEHSLNLYGNTLTAKLSSDDGFSAATTLHFTKANYPLSANISMSAFKLNRPEANKPISGKLQFHWKNISALQTALPYISNLKGEMRANLNVSGKLLKPVMHGSFFIKHDSFDLIKYGLKIRDFLFNGKIKENRLKLNGQATSNGKITFKGISYLRNPLQTTEIQLAGQDFQVINNNHYAIAISPNMTLTFTQNGNFVAGKLSIPHATLSPEDYSSTVTLPSNFVIIDNEPKDTMLSKHFDIDLHVILGKTIRLAYRGLHINLGGKLHITNKTEAGLRGKGTLHITKGGYKAYGKDLRIRTGIIKFNGGALDNPSLNILAVTTIPVLGYSGKVGINGIVAGVQITGTAQDVTLSLYSEPVMSQTDVLSYILFGRPSSDQGSSLEMLSTAIAMLASGNGNGGIMQNTQKRLGLSSFGFQTGQLFTANRSTPQTSQLFVVGKKLTDNIEVLYSVGLNVPVNVMMLRYKFAKNWLLQAQSSTFDTGGDVIYTFETD